MGRDGFPEPDSGRNRSETSGGGESFPPLTIDRDGWRELLPEDSYRVLFEAATEPACSSPMNEEHRDGLYLCAACHLPLFEASTRFESGTGWPSFSAPIPGRLGTRIDRDFGMVRTEYHCIRCGGHQGHVFEDGPHPTGLRFCNNGLALRFVPEGEGLPPMRG